MLFKRKEKDITVQGVKFRIREIGSMELIELFDKIKDTNTGAENWRITCQHVADHIVSPECTMEQLLEAPTEAVVELDSQIAILSEIHKKKASKDGGKSEADKEFEAKKKD